MKFKLYIVGGVLVLAGAAIIAFAPLGENLWGFAPVLIGQGAILLGWAIPRNWNWRNLR